MNTADELFAFRSLGRFVESVVCTSDTADTRDTPPPAPVGGGGASLRGYQSLMTAQAVMNSASGML